MSQPNARTNTLRLPLASEAATLALGAALAKDALPGRVLFLSGDLGAGKTTLVRGLLREIGRASCRERV